MEHDIFNPDQADQNRDEHRLYLEDLAEVIRTPAGARVVCRLLENLGTFEPVWSAKNPNLARAAVLHDFGQDILDDIALSAQDVHDDIQRMLRIRRKIGDALSPTPTRQE